MRLHCYQAICLESCPVVLDCALLHSWRDLTPHPRPRHLEAHTYAWDMVCTHGVKVSAQRYGLLWDSLLWGGMVTGFT